MTNQTPEQKARDEIDKQLVSAGWIVQSKDKINLAANKGVVIRECKSQDDGKSDLRRNIVNYSIIIYNSENIDVTILLGENFHRLDKCLTATSSLQANYCST